MKKKIFLIVVQILLIGSVIYLGGKVFFNGDDAEKEMILSATVWKLSEEGYTKDDIKSIDVDYNPLKGGVMPYQYTVYVVFNENPSDAIIYSWSNEKKEEVEYSGFGAAR